MISQNSPENRAPVEIYGPLGLRKFLRTSLHLSRSVLGLQIAVHELWHDSKPEDIDGIVSGSRHYVALRDLTSPFLISLWLHHRHLGVLKAYIVDIFSTTVISINSSSHPPPPPLPFPPRWGGVRAMWQRMSHTHRKWAGGTYTPTNTDTGNCTCTIIATTYKYSKQF